MSGGAEPGSYNHSLHATLNFSITEPCVFPGGVPEPAIWAMLTMAFGMVGGALRRRVAAGRRRAALA